MCGSGGIPIIGDLFGGGGKAPSVSPRPIKPPAVRPDLTNFSSFTPSGMTAPGFLGLSPEMTSIQRRAAIATGGVAGEGSGFRDPLAFQYYKDLLLGDLLDTKGNIKEGASFLPIERQFLEQVMGESLREDSPASFLSAVLRGTGAEFPKEKKPKSPPINMGYRFRPAYEALPADIRRMQKQSRLEDVL